MAPNHDPEPQADPNKVQEDDIREMEDVNQRLDALSCALDVFEQRTDDILVQLRELLKSNREIRRQIAEEQLREVSEVDGSEEDNDPTEQIDKKEQDEVNMEKMETEE